MFDLGTVHIHISIKIFRGRERERGIRIPSAVSQAGSNSISGNASTIP
jgi:hypothetical protein